ncbi:MAG: ABC transporter permease subunit [Roseivivax sp.]|nr:ABC transporter permease subunit [Roseivivax sp.]
MLASRAGLIWLAPATAIAVLAGPVLAGLAGTVLPAFGYFPSLGGRALSLDPFAALLAWPGLPASVWLSLGPGLLATVLSLGFAVLICAGWQGTAVFRAIERALSPVLSVPHAAAAFGLAFLIAPSGWIARALAPLAGWQVPPDVLILHDPWGLSLVAGLVAKEVPFLVLMMLAALPQARPEQSRKVAQALGYGRAAGWLKTVFPRVYPQIRLPVYAVLAYSMSAVDVAMILGPTTPPPLSVQVLAWMHDPDLALRFQAAAGAVLQLALVLVALALWRGAEALVATLGRRWAEGGARRAAEGAVRAGGIAAAGLTGGAALLGLAALALWSAAGVWRFPALWPETLGPAAWMRHGPELAQPLRDTALIGLGAVALALVLALWCLEAEQRGLRPPGRTLSLIYLPLIVPQVAFLTGLQALAIGSGLDGGPGAVLVVHLVFVLPYVMLSLGDPYRAWDRRFGIAAAALGASPTRIFWRVRLPMLLRPVLTAAAVGFAVSVGQYLPTLLIGAGRVQTVTTEAVALASGGDRRVIGVYGIVQTAAALVPFALAIVLPAVLWRNRRGLRHG